jgi:hypothetical protein
LLEYFKWAAGLDYVLTELEAVKFAILYDKANSVILPESLEKKECG